MMRRILRSAQTKRSETEEKPSRVGDAVPAPLLSIESIALAATQTAALVFAYLNAEIEKGKEQLKLKIVSCR